MMKAKGRATVHWLCKGSKCDFTSKYDLLSIWYRDLMPVSQTKHWSAEHQLLHVYFCSPWFPTSIQLESCISTVHVSGRICSSSEGTSALQQMVIGFTATSTERDREGEREKQSERRKNSAYCFEASPHPCLHLHFLDQYLQLELSSPSTPSDPPLAVAFPGASGNHLEP